MELFNNREIKKFTFKFLTLFILFIIAIQLLNLYNIRRLNQVIIKQNIGVIGALVKENPASEKAIVDNYTKGYDSNYNYGLSVMQKYSYDEGLEAYKNPTMNSFYTYGRYSLMFCTLAFGVVFYFLLLIDIKQTFKKIKSFALAAERIVEGDFTNYFEDGREGDIYVLGHQFNQMTKRLKESIEKLNKEKLNLKDIIADITHQLKTPLASLITFNEIIRNEPYMECEERNRFLDMSKGQLDRMEWLIKSLLKMARLEAGVINFNIKENIVKNTVLKAIEGIELKAKEKNITISIKGDEYVTFNHDSEWTGEALSNIVKNAVEHGRKYGKVELSWDETPLFIELKIEDDGAGIAKEEIPKIFKRFYKGQSSANPTSIGIGLYISKNIIEAQSGSIKVESKQGIGTKFIITFLKHII
ncbi:HAMP domain-containing sensor histidine kinase [Clostridium manihotivorum]|uniref:histidine kinase n=1 Tax=Clostridium manihotivorum TaxID=2320868 RepID=A0A410DZV1_9CLOT|nr:HAMP domain-containing sensor histidine kinase [Clostridium manihotivorum]QAA34574.1 sensor histidine kinase [Clostridium manihotivorum]